MVDGVNIFPMGCRVFMGVHLRRLAGMNRMLLGLVLAVGCNGQAVSDGQMSYLMTNTCSLGWDRSAGQDPSASGQSGGQGDAGDLANSSPETSGDWAPTSADVLIDPRTPEVVAAYARKVDLVKTPLWEVAVSRDSVVLVVQNDWDQAVWHTLKPGAAPSVRVDLEFGQALDVGSLLLGGSLSISDVKRLPEWVAQAGLLVRPGLTIERLTLRPRPSWWGRYSVTVDLGGDPTTETMELSEDGALIAAEPGVLREGVSVAKSVCTAGFLNTGCISGLKEVLATRLPPGARLGAISMNTTTCVVTLTPTGSVSDLIMVELNAREFLHRGPVAPGAIQNTPPSHLFETIDVPWEAIPALVVRAIELNQAKGFEFNRVFIGVGKVDGSPADFLGLAVALQIGEEEKQVVFDSKGNLVEN